MHLLGANGGPPMEDLVRHRLMSEILYCPERSIETGRYCHILSLQCVPILSDSSGIRILFTGKGAEGSYPLL